MEHLKSPYATHLLVLRRCVLATTGPVLELGVGGFSTPMLHHLCIPDRKLVSLDSDSQWFKAMHDYATSRIGGFDPAAHVVELVTNWATCPHLDEAWDVAFIDQDIFARGPSISRLADHTRLIVIHDTDEMENFPGGDSYGYWKVLPSLRYVWTCKKWRPWTSVASNVVDPVTILGPEADFGNEQ